MKKFFTLFLSMAVCSLAMGQYFFEDFEGGLPSSFVNENDIWVHGTAATISSAYFNPPANSQFVGVNDDGLGAGDNPDGKLITPEIDLTMASAPGLSFDAYFLDGDYQGADETAIVYITTDGGTNWEQVANLEGAGGWQTVNVDLAAFVGNVIQVGIEYNDGAGWNFGLCVDNILVQDIPDFDAKMLGASSFCGGGVVGVETEISGVIENAGTMNITSVDVNWSDGTNTYTETLSGLNMAPFDQESFSFTDKLSIPMGSADIDVWLSNVNGNGDDENTMNDATTFSVEGVELEWGRGVVVEEATGTWCPWCPRGTVWMELMDKCYTDNFVGVAVHNDDPMELAAYDSWLTSFPGFTGFPSVAFERDDILDPSQIEQPTIDAASVPPVALLKVGATYDEATRELNLRTFVEPQENLSGDYKLNIVITEDGVTGTSSGYNQFNNYAGGGNGPMGGYENLPNPVPAAQMVYDHVGRALLAGAEGTADAIPTDMVAGESYSHDWDTYTIPSDYEAANLHLNVMLYNPNGTMANAWSYTIDEAVALLTNTAEVNVAEESVKVSPNPFTDATNIRLTLDDTQDVSIRVMNAVGQEVAARNYGELMGDLVLPFNAANLQGGMYFIQIQVGEQMITKKVMVAK